MPPARVIDGRSKIRGDESLRDGLFPTVRFVLHMKMMLARLQEFL